MGKLQSRYSLQMRILPTLFLLFLFLAGHGQTRRLVLQVRDSSTATPLDGASIVNSATGKGGVSTRDGIYVTSLPDSGILTLLISATGYSEVTQSFALPYAGADTVIVLLGRNAENLSGVVISSLRTGNRIEDLPMKVEVLGLEEMKEESGIKPGNISSLLGDLSVIHVQNISPVMGSAAIRMQGLDGKYTQLLRDGLPLYDGISGNFGVLSIPPLDLKQVEIIKGSVSTLFGGGAIAGMINFISRAPTQTPEFTALINHSTLTESNGNIFFSQRWKKAGLSFFGGVTIQDAVDVNKDGFSDVPKLSQYILHPRFFYYFNTSSTLELGYSGTFEKREGGDLRVLDGKSDSVHQYYDRNHNNRHSVDAQYTLRNLGGGRLLVKAALSRYAQTEDEISFITAGRQWNNYQEISFNKKIKQNDFVAGINHVGENYQKDANDSTAIANYDYQTYGVFLQDGIHFSNRVMAEAGIRFDYHNQYHSFFLPRVALVYKPVSGLSFRLAVGTGYKVPEIFTTETQRLGYQKLLPLDQHLKPEKSYGINFDANWETDFGEVKMTINQALYYTNIKDPIVPVALVNGFYQLQNSPDKATSIGTDTYIQGVWNDWELYAGYNHTISQYSDAAKSKVPFAPQDKLSFTLAYSIGYNWRMGLESSWISNQYLPDQTKAPAYWFWAAMVQRNFGKHFSVVLNCENIFDARQGKHESLYDGPVSDPQFKPLWGPIDGRVINLSVKFTR